VLKLVNCIKEQGARLTSNRDEIEPTSREPLGRTDFGGIRYLASILENKLL
jgi:hypothetical protein